MFDMVPILAVETSTDLVHWTEADLADVSSESNGALRTVTVRDAVSFNGQVVRIDPKRPQNRDRVQQRNTRPAFLRDNPIGTQNIGPRRITAGADNGPAQRDKPGSKGAGRIAVAKGKQRGHGRTIATALRGGKA